MRSLALALALQLALSLQVRFASAQNESPAPQTLAPDARVDFSTQPPSSGATPESANTAGEGVPPPPPPRRPGLVVESTAGVLNFAGQFRHVAPPAYWMHALVGYEPLNWLMFFGEGELALASTGEAQGPSQMRAFPLWGFGGGGRATLHATSRLAAFAEGEIGALAAYVPHNALGVLGFHGAESLGMQVGGRVGVEWYQVDRHLALTASGGPRFAQNFARFGGGDLPLMWDLAIGLRYSF